MKIKNYFLIYLVILFYILTLTACSSDSGSDDDGGEDVQTYTVSGTVTLPASVTDEDFYVNIDKDHDGSNGWVASVSGKATGTTFTYSISNVPAGSYWIYGAVNTSGGQMGPWEDGDYVGDQQITVDGDETVNLTFALYEENHDGSCPDLGDSSLEGSMTILDPVVNGMWVVVIDENSNPDDGFLTCQEGDIPASATTFDYEISSKIPAGTYKVYVMIFGNGNMDSPTYASNGYEVTFTGTDTQYLDFPLLIGLFCDDAGDSTLNGNLIMPDSAEGGMWWVILDNDYDMGNGWTTCFTGYISNSDTVIPYEVPDRIPAGTYYIYAMVLGSYSLEEVPLYTAGFDGSMQVTFSEDDTQTLDISVSVF